MAYAPLSVYNTFGDGSIIGCFDEKDDGKHFEFSENNENFQALDPTNEALFLSDNYNYIE